MSLGIFSFDLAGYLESWEDFWTSDDPEPLPATGNGLSDPATDVSPNAALTTTEKPIDDAAMTAALTSAMTSIISSTAENATKSTAVSSASARKTLDEALRKEIERLQTSVIHNYKDTDIIDESVSRTTVSNAARRKPREDSDGKKDSVEQQKKIDERRLQLLREELKKAILKNNAEV